MFLLFLSTGNILFADEIKYALPGSQDLYIDNFTSIEEQGTFTESSFNVSIYRRGGFLGQQICVDVVGGSGNFFYEWDIRDGLSSIYPVPLNRSCYTMPCASFYRYRVTVTDLNTGIKKNVYKRISNNVACEPVDIDDKQCIQPDAEFSISREYGPNNQVYGYRFYHPTYTNIPTGVQLVWKLQEFNGSGYSTIGIQHGNHYDYPTGGNPLQLGLRMCLTITIGNGLCQDTHCESSQNWFTSQDDVSLREDNTSNTQEIANWNIYPNPTTSNLNVDFHLKEETTTDISIFDTTGKQVHQEQHNGVQGQNNVQLNLSSLPNGIYYVKMNNEAFHKTERIVIQKNY